MKTVHCFFLGLILTPAFLYAESLSVEPGAKIFVPAAVTELGTETNVYRYTGQIVPISTVNITSRISADLKEVGFKEGDHIKKGQLLYVFDSTRYEATLKSDQAKIEEYEAKLIYVKNDYERTNQLYEKGVSTKDEMESALSQYKAYNATLLGAKADLILSEDDYEHCKIYSPISGVIGRTNYTEGNYITPSSGVLATIVQHDPIRLRFSMSTRDFLKNFTDISGLKDNCSVKIQLADRTFYEAEGEIEFIDNEAVRATDTILVFAKFKNPNSRLLPNNTVAVYVQQKEGRQKVSIPVTALMHDDQSSYVYVLDDKDIPHRRNVVLGRADGGVQFIDSGLSEGERVVSDGPHKVIENMRVSVTN